MNNWCRITCQRDRSVNNWWRVTCQRDRSEQLVQHHLSAWWHICEQLVTRHLSAWQICEQLVTRHLSAWQICEQLVARHLSAWQICEQLVARHLSAWQICCIATVHKAIICRSSSAPSIKHLSTTCKERRQNVFSLIDDNGKPAAKCAK